jgi:hypothetical protein
VIAIGSIGGMGIIPVGTGGLIEEHVPVEQCCLGSARRAVFGSIQVRRINTTPPRRRPVGPRHASGRTRRDLTALQRRVLDTVEVMGCSSIGTTSLHESSAIV